MNWYLFAGGILIILSGLLHSALGEQLIFRRLSAQPVHPDPDADVFLKRVLRTFWHQIDIVWWGLAAVLIYLGTRPTLDPSLESLDVVEIR